MFNQQNYVNKYIKENYKTIKLRIRNDDKAIIKKINEIENINRYILNLIKKDILENRKYNFINDDVKIDFELSKTMKDLVDKCEKADLINDYGLYMNVADAIDSQGKKETTHHIITETEWKKVSCGKKLVRRYEI